MRGEEKISENTTENINPACVSFFLLFKKAGSGLFLFRSFCSNPEIRSLRVRAHNFAGNRTYATGVALLLLLCLFCFFFVLGGFSSLLKRAPGERADDADALAKRLARLKIALNELSFSLKSGCMHTLLHSGSGGGRRKKKKEVATKVSHRNSSKVKNYSREEKLRGNNACLVSCGGQIDSCHNFTPRVTKNEF